MLHNGSSVSISLALCPYLLHQPVSACPRSSHPGTSFAAFLSSPCLRDISSASFSRITPLSMPNPSQPRLRLLLTVLPELSSQYIPNPFDFRHSRWNCGLCYLQLRLLSYYTQSQISQFIESLVWSRRPTCPSPLQARKSYADSWCSPKSTLYCTSLPFLPSISSANLVPITLFSYTLTNSYLL